MGKIITFDPDYRSEEREFTKNSLDNLCKNVERSETFRIQAYDDSGETYDIADAEVDIVNGTITLFLK